MTHRWNQLLCPVRPKEATERVRESIDTGIGRHELERDYDRILFSAPTRRMADKTQAFPLEPNSSVRTRLTHSHEVSNLARSIGTRLVYEHREQVFGKRSSERELARSVPSALAAIGLAHDIGNPPFGHQGEKAIGQWFGDHGYDDPDFLTFDGNRQTFRIFTRLQLLNDEHGLNLTYATLAGLLKYPAFAWSYRELDMEKFGLYGSDSKKAHDVWTQTGLKEGHRHPFAIIMEACDDIAYSVIDAEDTIKKGYASFDDLERWLRSDGTSDETVAMVVDAARKKRAEFAAEKISDTELDNLTMLMFRVKAIAEMVMGATSSFVENVGSILDGSVGPSFQLVGASKPAILCKRLKAFAKTYGYGNEEVQRLELAGAKLIRDTMDALWSAIDGSVTSERLCRYVYGRISENYRRVYEASDRSDADRCHLLCDMVSGMSEGYLIALHHDLEAVC